MLGGKIYIGGIGAVRDPTVLQSIGIYPEGAGLIVNAMGDHYRTGHVPVPLCLVLLMMVMLSAIIAGITVGLLQVR